MTHTLAEIRMALSQIEGYTPSRAELHVLLANFPEANYTFDLARLQRATQSVPGELIPHLVRKIFPYAMRNEEAVQRVVETVDIHHQNDGIVAQAVLLHGQRNFEIVYRMNGAESFSLALDGRHLSETSINGYGGSFADRDRLETMVSSARSVVPRRLYGTLTGIAQKLPTATQNYALTSSRT